MMLPFKVILMNEESKGNNASLMIHIHYLVAYSRTGTNNN